MLPPKGKPKGILEIVTFNELWLNQNFPSSSQSINGSFKYRKVTSSYSRQGKRRGERGGKRKKTAKEGVMEKRKDHM